MINVLFQGRLGNRMLLYATGCVFSHFLKLKLNVDIQDITFHSDHYQDFYDYFKINVPPYSKIVEEPEILITDDFLKNNFNLIKANLSPALYKIEGSQTGIFIEHHLPIIEDVFQSVKPVEQKPGVWVHARLGDQQVVQSGTLEYYRSILSKLDCRNGVLRTDAMSVNEDIIKTLLDEFQLTLHAGTPVQALHDCRSYQTMVLSSGTFSWWMGILSKAPEVYYYNVPTQHRWHGEIFNIKNWKGVDG